MVKIVKLITGEEIIGTVTHKDGKIILRDCAAIAQVPSRDAPGQMGLGLVPYAAYTKNHSITVDESKIVWEEELVEEVYNQYNKVFGSGIQIVGGAL